MVGREGLAKDSEGEVRGRFFLLKLMLFLLEVLLEETVGLFLFITFYFLLLGLKTTLGVSGFGSALAEGMKNRVSAVKLVLEDGGDRLLQLARLLLRWLWRCRRGRKYRSRWFVLLAALPARRILFLLSLEQELLLAALFVDLVVAHFACP